jgi:hypothetical protein
MSNWLISLGIIIVLPIVIVALMASWKSERRDRWP